MECIFCGGKTAVTNSRKQVSTHNIWRRRACTRCKSVFTTEEAPVLDGSLTVRTKNGSIQHFDRDKLFLSIYEALRHRKTALRDATALTKTIIAGLTKNGSAHAILCADIAAHVFRVLTNFDQAASVQYRAYHID